jgi:hypothetical protein
VSITLKALKPSSRALSTCIHSATGGLSIDRKAAGSNAL